MESFFWEFAFHKILYCLFALNWQFHWVNNSSLKYFLRILNSFFHYLLTSSVAVHSYSWPFCMICFFSLEALGIFSLFLVFWNFRMMSFNVRFLFCSFCWTLRGNFPSLDLWPSTLENLFYFAITPPFSLFSFFELRCGHLGLSL